MLARRVGAYKRKRNQRVLAGQEMHRLLSQYFAPAFRRRASKLAKTTNRREEKRGKLLTAQGDEASVRDASS